MNTLALLRAAHVLGVVIWIGGVFMVTAVLLPALRCGELGADQLRAFRSIEGRFVWIARACVLLVGASGLWLIEALDMWPRFALAGFWWMHLMLATWAVFALLLFVLEPLVLHRWFPAWATRDPQRALAFMQWAHVFLLLLTLVTVAASVAGAHGALWFAG